MKQQKLTVRQMELVKGVAEGKTITQAGLNAGYGRGINRRSAAVQASRELTNPNVSAHLKTALEGVLLELDDALLVIKDALDATKVQYFAHDGIVKDSRTTVDHRIRLQAAELCLRLHGFLSNREQEVEPQPSVSDVIIAIREERIRRGLDIPTKPFEGNIE